MEASGKQKEEWNLLIGKNSEKKNGNQCKQKEDWRRVISRKKNGDE